MLEIDHMFNTVHLIQKCCIYESKFFASHINSIVNEEKMQLRCD